MTLNYKGFNIFYTEEGNGFPVVLLHGFLENSTMWKNIVSEISKTNRVICIDLPGHGQTDCFEYIHSMELMAEVVKVVLTHLKVSISIFVGHSLGGYVALAFAEENPDKIKALCLINSTASADSEIRIQQRNRAIELSKSNYKNLINMSITNLFRPKNRTLFSADIKEIKKEALKTPLQGYIAGQEGIKIRKNREFILRSSDYKKMIILGKKDPVLNYNTIIKQIQNTKTEVIALPDGHMSHIENKKELIFTLKQFIGNL